MLAPEYVRCKEAKKLKTGKSKKQIHEEVKNEAMELLKRIGLESKADVYPSNTFWWSKTACRNCACTCYESGCNFI